MHKKEKKTYRWDYQSSMGKKKSAKTTKNTYNSNSMNSIRIMKYNSIQYDKE